MRLGLIVATRHAPRVPASLLASRGMAIKRNRRSRMARVRASRAKPPSSFFHPLPSFLSVLQQPDLTVDKDVRELLENTRVNDQVRESSLLVSSFLIKQEGMASWKDKILGIKFGSSNLLVIPLNHIKCTFSIMYYDIR